MVRALLSAGASLTGTLSHLGLLKVIVNTSKVAVTSSGPVAKPQVQHAPPVVRRIGSRVWEWLEVPSAVSG